MEAGTPIPSASMPATSQMAVNAGPAARAIRSSRPTV
jgi:hypothetical protein